MKDIAKILGGNLGPNNMESDSKSALTDMIKGLMDKESPDLVPGASSRSINTVSSNSTGVEKPLFRVANCLPNPLLVDVEETKVVLNL